MNLLEQREAEFEAAKEAASAAETALEAAQAALIKVMPVSLDPNDWRLVVSGDDTWRHWRHTQAMLDDVFGDCWCECKDTDCRSTYGECEPSEDAQKFIDAFEGNGDSREGIMCYSAVLQLRNPLTDEFETEDSCGGFFGLSSDGAPMDQIRDQLEPNGMVGRVPVEFE